LVIDILGIIQTKHFSFEMIDFITSHPLYIPFLVFNTLVVYEVVKNLRGGDKGKNDDDDNDGGIYVDDDPVLDLPPGVTLPTPSREPVLSD
jgi:hypothetical protein